MPISNLPVVLITGVSGGIGQAAARLFVANGWRVVGTVRAKRANMAGVDIQPAEMTRSTDLVRLVGHVQRRYGRLDALVSNAGYALHGPLESLSYAQMRDQMATNFLAPAELTRLAMPMLAASSGSAVAISSLVGRIGLPDYSVYAASKHALEGLYESLALELDGSIRFKLVEPSGVDTAFWTALQRGTGNARGRQPAQPAPNRADQKLTPELVAGVIYRAACDRSSKLHYPLGQTRRLDLAKRMLPGWLYRRLLLKFYSNLR